MANPKGNPQNLKKFVKGDPRINRKGAPKKLPILKELMAQLLGSADGEDATDSELAAVVKTMIATAKSKSNMNSVNAAKEILDRTFGKVKSEDPNTNISIVWEEHKHYDDGKDKKKKA